MKFLLKVSADLLNLSELDLDVGDNNPHVGLYLKMQCTTCNELQPKMITAVSDVKWSDLKKAPPNSMKCKGCTSSAAVSVSSAKQNSPSENEIYVPLLEINSSLFKPVDCIFSGGWKAHSITGKIFHDIDLSSGEFYDYDEDRGCPVSITNLKVMFEATDGEESGSSSALKSRKRK